jgi:hypothetical protein
MALLHNIKTTATINHNEETGVVKHGSTIAHLSDISDRWCGGGGGCCDGFGFGFNVGVDANEPPPPIAMNILAGLDISAMSSSLAAGLAGEVSLVATGISVRLLGLWGGFGIGVGFASSRCRWRVDANEPPPPIAMNLLVGLDISVMNSSLVTGAEPLAGDDGGVPGKAASGVTGGGYSAEVVDVHCVVGMQWLVVVIVVVVVVEAVETVAAKKCWMVKWLKVAAAVVNVVEVVVLVVVKRRLERSQGNNNSLGAVARKSTRTGYWHNVWCRLEAESDNSRASNLGDCGLPGGRT